MFHDADLPETSLRTSEECRHAEKRGCASPAPKQSRRAARPQCCPTALIGQAQVLTSWGRPSLPPMARSPLQICVGRRRFWTPNVAILRPWLHLIPASLILGNFLIRAQRNARQKDDEFLEKGPSNDSPPFIPPPSSREMMEPSPGSIYARKYLRKAPWSQRGLPP